MKFKQLPKQSYSDMERDIIAFWKEDKTFEASVDMRPKDNSYVFYDGPPFLTGLPHYGHLLGSIIKDVVPRYWTMKGKRVERVWGWDCHGLPAENYVEKKLGIKDKRDVQKVGLHTYIQTCHDSMLEVSSEWEDTVDRIGRWVEFKGAYKTMDPEYMESVWWAFKTLYDKGKIYEGEKVLLYCTRCATPISKAEVAMDNSYQDVTDASVYVRLKLTDEGAYLLAWTTTPWTLHANTAAAVNSKVEYSRVEYEGNMYYLASDTVSKVFVDEKHQPLDFKVAGKIKGKDLVGKSYEPLFGDRGKGAHVVLDADYVSTEEGTGVVHLAPAYGEEDYLLAKENGVPMIVDVDENGEYIEGPWKGQQVWEASKKIAKELHEQGSVIRIEYIRHSYPHCHRCQTKLMYRAHPSWFMDIDGQRTEMLSKNQTINWYPEYLKNGRFHNIVESAPDWNLSRDRFWATAMPVWRGKDNNGNVLTKVVGSYEELEQLSGKRLDDYHRPYVDEVTFEIDGVSYTRIDKVLDCWFESGSMPFAQFHYPFENKQKFDDNFPGDFIVEYVGQVRAWFYYLHAVSIALFNKPSFKNVVVTGTIAGNDGRKMSKSFGNYTDPTVLLDQYSADALRCLLLSSPVVRGEDFSLLDKDVADVHRKLGTLRNTLDFFLLYAEADQWEYSANMTLRPTHILDIWITERLKQVSAQVDGHMQEYNLQASITPIFEFIYDLSNWYVRRSRKRFWKSDSDEDKNDAYLTLYSTLVNFSRVIAPFAPFLADHMYRTLTQNRSVHLENWQYMGAYSSEVVESMRVVRELVTEGLAARAKAGIKVRQPLASIEVQDANKLLTEDLMQIIADELNVKSVAISDLKDQQVKLDTKITKELENEGLMRELIRHIQNHRKDCGLDISDRILLTLSADSDQMKKVIETYQSEIMNEVLATSLKLSGNTTNVLTVDTHDVGICIEMDESFTKAA